MNALVMCLSSKDGHILFYGEEKGTGLKKGKKNYRKMLLIQISIIAHLLMKSPDPLTLHILSHLL